MAKPRVEKLTLTKFRGSCKSTTLEFAADKDVVLIFGENGTGKSSIVDALDFVCNNGFGSLRDRSGTTPHKHVVAVDAVPKDLEVVLDFGGREWRATLQGQRPVIRPANPPRAFILRRTDITRVMEAAPADRYKALQAYITVPNVERAEAELRKAAKEAGDAVKRAEKERSLALEALERYWHAENRPDVNAMAWAERKGGADSRQLQARIEEARQFLLCLENALSAYNHLFSVQQRVDEAEKSRNAAQRTLDAETAALAGQSDIMVSLLQSALIYLQGSADEMMACPVCGKPERHTALVGRVQKELDQLTRIRDLAEMRALREEAWHEAKGAMNTARDHFVKQCHIVAEWVSQAQFELAGGVDLPALAGATVDSGSLEAASTMLLRLAQQRAIMGQSIDEDQKTVNQMSALRSHLQTITKAEQEMRFKARTAERLKAMLTIVEYERKAYIDNLMQTVGQHVNDLYARIHPGEPLGGSTFSVKKTTTGSLELKAQFAGASDVAPGAYYSEAHLDTLGLCVYLALARHSSAGNNIVVLDDVLTSVDEVHLERVIQLITEEAPHFGHLIITTHSRTWFDRVRMGRGMNADLVELYGWDLTNGMRHTRAPLHSDELRQVATTPKLDRQAAASKAGVLLEQLLDDLTLRYECRVRRTRDARYSLGELADALLNSRVSKTLTAQRLREDGTWASVQIRPLVEACAEFTWVRNQVGAHFNLRGAGIPDDMVREFAMRVLGLADALLCPTCGQLPVKDKSGEYWECGGGCGKTRLRPLRAPTN